MTQVSTQNQGANLGHPPAWATRHPPDTAQAPGALQR